VPSRPEDGRAKAPLGPRWSQAERWREPETDRGEEHKQPEVPAAPSGPPRYCSAAVSDRRSRHTSKYTLDRGVPGAFEGETITRRRFMTGSANAAGAIAVGAFTLPALAFAIGPIFKQQGHTWVDIGLVGDFTENEYSPVVATITPGVGEIGKTTAYVRKRNAALDTDPADRETPYIAISTRCAHVGCPVRWTPAAERFVCPCHGGVYDVLGRRVSGPPVRPLDRFPTRVRGNIVQLFTGRFSLNSQLRRFSPRDPGEPLDGIGQYLYPSRPSSRKL
jgi:quinol---cytochrome c reductase iron-sulfur subunit, bacillus type